MVFIGFPWLVSRRSDVNLRHLPASSLRNGRPTWVQVLVAGVLFLSAGSAAYAQDQKIGQSDGGIFINGSPVAPPPKDDAGNLLQGAGLCGAFRIIDGNDQTLRGVLFQNRPDDFPQPTALARWSGPMNAFMDGNSGSTARALYQTLQTPFDLASKINLNGIKNVGDFIGSCPAYTGMMGVGGVGCPFPGSGTNLDIAPLPSFGSRFRGFILIPANLQGQAFHIGFFTQNEVALIVFDKDDKGNAQSHDVVSRTVNNGSSHWRVTNKITFKNPGLFPIEVLHANVGEPAVLEMVALTSDPTFVDIDGTENSTTSLAGPGFNLIFTTPDRFFQTSSGKLPFADPAQCQQCPRGDANSVDVTCSLNPGYFCNEAAVCSPCVGDQFCGNSCKNCKNVPGRPFCARIPGTGGTDYDCFQCVIDTDCASGQKCIQGTCTSPCACCGDSPFCVVTDKAGQPSARNCTACRTDSDCGDAKCDLLNGRCIDKIPDCNTDDKCGVTCVNCITSTATDPLGPRPHCLNGQVCAQCRNDVDCKAGTYCRSGDCVPCTHDRHCGASCQSCGLDFSVIPATEVGKDPQVKNTPTDKPFCLAPNGAVPTASCVQCLTDENCGDGGTCDPVTHTCNTGCDPPCTGGKVCAGTVCVDCMTSSQCSCGQCVGGVCTPSCGDSTDCRSNQCCGQETSTCVNGRCKPGLTAHGGALCCDASGATLSSATDPAAAPLQNRLPLVALLAALAMLFALRLRGLRATAGAATDVRRDDREPPARGAGGE